MQISFCPCASSARQFQNFLIGILIDLASLSRVFLLADCVGEINILVFLQNESKNDPWASRAFRLKRSGIIRWRCLRTRYPLQVTARKAILIRADRHNCICIHYTLHKFATKSIWAKSSLQKSYRGRSGKF